MSLSPSSLFAPLLMLAACSRGPQDAPTAGIAAAAGAPASRGARLYQQNCVPCHRDDARGVPGVYPGLAGSPVVNGDPVTLARWVLNGERPATMPAGRYGTQMLRFGWMKDADAAELLSFVRTSFGNQASSVDEASVGRARSGQ